MNPFCYESDKAGTKRHINNETRPHENSFDDSHFE
jgi:hypothetical protein